MKTLGGSIFVRDGIKFDYNFTESIDCLLEFCDQVAIVDAGSSDGTKELLLEKYSNNRKVRLWCFESTIWNTIEGKEKLVYFTDRAIDLLSTDWNFYLQADEILSEKSYEYVRQAIESSKYDSFLCRRINLWKSPFLKINVPQHRQPCSEIVCRLAKTKYKSYGDAESLRTDGATCGHDFVEAIKIFHMGFVRKREVMKSKIENMQINVFGMANADDKLYQADGFNPDLWFSHTELEPIKEPLPKIIQTWAMNRI